MGKLRYDRYMHIGVVVENIEAALDKLKTMFDLGPYVITDFPPKELDRDQVQLFYHGKKDWFTARFCFIQMGSSEIELIEPVEGESVWKDFLRENGEGVHHLKYEVDSVNETIRSLREAGISCSQYGSAVGKNLGKTWAYFDTQKELGYVIEVLGTQLGEKIEA